MDFEGKNEKLVTLKIDDVTDTFAFSREITSGPNWFSESESTTKSIVGYGLNGIDQNVTEKWKNYSQLDGKGRSTDSPDWTAYGSTTGKNDWDSKNSLTMPNPGQIWSGWHGIQIIGGVAEFVAGAGVTFITGGWATPFGILMMANGLDQIITGGQNWIIGSHSMSVFESAGYSAARWAGASERIAHVVGALTPAAISLGSLTGSWSVSRLGLTVDSSASFGGVRVASGIPEKILPATTVRQILKHEKVNDLINEVKQLTYESGGLEHAIVSLTGGGRVIMRGGPGGMEFGSEIRRVLLHTHPTTTGPSSLDFLMLKQLRQRHSYIYELFGGGLTRFGH